MGREEPVRAAALFGLAAEAIRVRVLNMHTVKPLDRDAVLAAATHNPFFNLVSRPITELLYSIYINKSGYMSFRSLTSSEHTSIVHAIEGKDSEGAAASMQKHLDRVGTTVEELLAENDGEIG